MRVLVRDWTQLANRASDHLSRSLYISTPYPPITSAVRLATIVAGCIGVVKDGC